jgi:hypothetical protein
VSETLQRSLGGALASARTITALSSSRRTELCPAAPANRTADAPVNARCSWKPIRGMLLSCRNEKA